MPTRTCTDLTTRGHYPIAQFSGLKPTMLASSMQAVVACNATAPRVCTLVLFILSQVLPVTKLVYMLIAGVH